MTVTAPPRAAAPPPPARPSAGRRIAGALLRLVAAADRHAHRDRAALPARAGRRARLAAAAAVAVAEQRHRSTSPTTPTLAPVLDRLYLFDVFSSPWFAAVYLLLFVSLIGCVLPRALEHVRALRAAPPPAPRDLLRLPDAGELTTALPADEALDAVEEELAGPPVPRRPARGGELSAEKGYLKETGNLLFHLSLVALLLGLAGGKLWGYEGSILVTEGQGFCNSFQQYDTYSSGALVDSGDLAADLRRPRGLPRRVRAGPHRVVVHAPTSATARRARTAGPPTIGINDPLRVDGERVYVTGHGFSPTFSVTPSRRHRGHRRLRAVPAGRPEHDGQRGRAQAARPRAPRATTSSRCRASSRRPGVVQGGVLTSVDPRPLAPQVAIVVYEGYLGLDSGIPQSVYSLDAAQIDRGRLTEAGRGQPVAGGVADPGRRHDGHLHRLPRVRRAAVLRTTPARAGCSGPRSPCCSACSGCCCCAGSGCSPGSPPRPGGGGTVLTLASLTRGSGENGPRFAALSDDLAPCARRPNSRRTGGLPA